MSNSLDNTKPISPESVPLVTANTPPDKSRLVGQNYTTPDLMAKVTGRSKYAEDFRALTACCSAKLLLSPHPHARVLHIDASEALAMPGVKGMIPMDDLPAPADAVAEGQVIKASKWGERGLAMEPVYHGEPILAIAAVDELTAADAIEKIKISYQPLPFVVDPLVSLRPGGPNARTDGTYGCGPPMPPRPQGLHS